MKERKRAILVKVPRIGTNSNKFHQGPFFLCPQPQKRNNRHWNWSKFKRPAEPFARKRVYAKGKRNFPKHNSPFNGNTKKIFRKGREIQRAS